MGSRTGDNRSSTSGDIRAGRRVVISSRLLRVIELRISGATYPTIGKELGFSRQRAEQLCQRAQRIFNALVRRIAVLEDRVEILELQVHQSTYIKKKMFLEPITDEDPVTFLAVTRRAKHVLHRAQIVTVRQLCNRSPEELLALGRCGISTVENIQGALVEVERHLRGWLPTDPQEYRVWRQTRGNRTVIEDLDASDPSH